MKFLFALVIVVSGFITCKKGDAPTQTGTPVLCLDTAYLKTNIPELLLSVFFINEKDGFIGTYKGGIYKTSDSAKHWVSLNSTVNLPIYSLYFTDSLTGFAAGGQSTCTNIGCTPADGFILKTTDGGQTWNKVYTPTDKIEITSIQFVNASLGFCVGNNIIMKTTDGGQHWNEYKVSNLNGKMQQIKFVNTLKGYVVCLSGKILKTEDGGVNWEVTTPRGTSDYYYSVSASGGATYIAGSGKIIKSTDGGSSWNELPNSPTDIYAMHFINDQKGFAFGSGSYSGGDFGYTLGSIYCTDDGGITWNGSRDINAIGPIKFINFPSATIGYALFSNWLIKLTSK